MQTAQDVITALHLAPIAHEGGWFRRLDTGPVGADGRAAWSSIVALFTRENYSALHRLAVDEVWSFHAGDPIELLLLHADGRAETRVLGLSGAVPESPVQIVQTSVPAGCWQGARPVSGGHGWSLISCVCVPGFEWSDFELAERGRLVAAYPGCRPQIEGLTH